MQQLQNKSEKLILNLHFRQAFNKPTTYTTTRFRTTVSTPWDFQQVCQAKNKICRSRAPQMTQSRPNIADDVLEMISMA